METSAPYPGKIKAAKRSSFLLLAWHRFSRRKAALAGLIFIIFEIILATIAPLLVDLNIIVSPYYNDYAVSYQPPSNQHLFGTDEFGRDMLSRVIFGTQVSYAVGIGANVIGTLLGMIIGSIAGQVGGWVDF